jgi:hypothetical protein
MKILRCDECEVWISIKLDRQPLPGGVGSVEIFEAHLAACAPCRRLLAEEAMRSAFLREELCGARDPLTPLAAAILEESSRPNGAQIVPIERAAARPSSWRVPAALAAVAAVLVVAAGLLGWQFWWQENSDLRGADASQLRLIFEETLEDSHVVPGAGGAPMREDVERVRRYFLPLPARNGGTRGIPETEAGMGLEKVKTRNVRLVNWPMR